MARPAARDATVFDGIITRDMIVENAGDARRYGKLTVEGDGRQRSYTLLLRPTGEMVENRHFSLITAEVSLAGPEDEKLTEHPTLSSSAGPNGSFTEAAVLTTDRRFAIRATHGVLLPASVQIAMPDTGAIAQRISVGYMQLITAQKGERNE